MLVKRLKAKRECAIKTKADRHYFGVGDVADVKFANKAEFESHMQTGFYEETREPVGFAEIPIVLPNGNFVVPIVEGVAYTTPDVPSTTIIDLDMTKTPEAVVITPPDLDMTKEPEVIEHVLTNEEILQRENAKGKPYKCLKDGCGRQRKKTSLYCDVCLENMEG